MKKLILKILSMQRPINGFNIFESDGYIWGVGSKGEILFGIDSSSSKYTEIVQTTSHLKLFINHKFNCCFNGENAIKNLSLYVLLNEDSKLRELFIRLCFSMMDNLNEEQMLRNFFNLKDLFKSERRPSLIELQGMYGELFTIYYLKTCHNIDISTFYQKEEKRKFDFSLTEKKKIEIKTTLKPERIHHFLHQQLDSDRFDIILVSLMLQKDDCGLSLLNLINQCKTKFSNYLMIILYIEMMIKNIDENDLESIKFNFDYSKSNIKLFKGKDIPRIKERDINGIFNVEYDVDLENVNSLSLKNFEEWIKN